MAAKPLPRLLILLAVAVALLWLAALGLLARSGRADAFASVPTVDYHLSAQPGVNLTAAELAAERLPGILAEVAGRGIRYVRFPLAWDEIEPQRGAYAWGAADAVMAAFAARPELTPVALLNRSPAWARPAQDAGNPLAPPHERRDYGAFVRTVAERYAAHLTFYQVWDEPNIAPHWGARPADPGDYLGLLREAAVNLRAADPDARILAAALAPTTEGGGANLSDITYLDRLYALGGRQWFDYPAAQPYGYKVVSGIPAPSQLNFARVELLRDVMLRHGDADTMLWATAFGWNLGDDGPWGAVSAREQAEYTEAAFAVAAGTFPWLGPLFWTNRFPMTPATQQVLAQRASPVRELGPGHHAPDAPALIYRGWRTTPSAADPSAEGDTLEFKFVGSGVALEVQGGPYWAYLTVSVDGAPANRLPRDESGASYLVLHDPDLRMRRIPLAENLHPVTHSVRLVAHGGWGQWPLRGVVVTAAPPRVDLLGPGLLALAVLGSLVVGVVGWRARVRDLSGFENLTGLPRANPPYLTGLHRRLGRGNLLGLARAGVWVLATCLCALYLLSGSGVVNLAALGLLGLLFLARPQLAPPLIAAALPWWQRTQPVLRWQFGLFEVLAWVAVLAWLGRSALGWAGRPAAGAPAPRRMVLTKLDISVVALSAAGLLATVFAAEQGVAWREFRIVFLFGLVLYLLVTRGPGRVRGRVVLLLGGLLAGATLASLAGLWQLVTGQGRVDVEGVGRIAGFYGSPNNLALVLDRAAPLVAALALFGLSTHPGLAARTKRAGRVFFGVAAVVILAAALSTFSKGAYLLGLPVGLGVVLLGGAWRSGRRWPVWALLALAAAGGLALVVLFQTPRFAGLFNFQGGTSFFRLKLWQGSLNMALDHPLLGVGPDNFLYAYRTRYVLPSAWQELNLSHPHNLLLDLWTRLGLVGVLAGLGALVAAFAAGWRLLYAGRRQPGSAVDVVWPLFLGLLGGLGATVSHGLIDNSLFLPDLMGWFVSALAVFRLYSDGDL